MAPKGEHKSTRQAKLAYFWQNTQHARIQITATNPHYHHCCIAGEINIAAQHRHPKFNLKKYSTLAFRQWLLAMGGLSRHREEAQHPRGEALMGVPKITSRWRLCNELFHMFMKTSSQCGQLNGDTDIRNLRIFVGTWPAYKMENGVNMVLFVCKTV